MSNHLVPRWMSRHWLIKCACVVLAAVLWLLLKERIAPGTTESFVQWLERSF